MSRFITYCFSAFLILAVTINTCWSQGNINAMEYFIDNGDLGAGANTVVPITNGSTISESFVIPQADFPGVGFHTIYFRIQDTGGQWSISESRSFYVSESNLTTQANIVNVEYFIDTDPGYGSGISLGAFATTTVTLNPIIPTSGLSAGFHVLYTRSLDSDGFWGNVESRSFYISQSDLTSTATIVEVRYYIDTDPGYGNGIIIPITSSTTINTSATIATSALLAGHHVLYVRSLDSDGVWSETESRSFYIDAFTAGLISGIEYFYDTDPGFANGSNFPIAPAVASIDQVVDLPTSALAAGTHELGIRMINENGVYGMTEYYSVTLCDVAIANFTTDVVCIGTSTTITETSTGTLAGDVYSWDFDADGFEDASTGGNQSFNFSTSGIFNATLSIDRAGCVSTITVPVQVEAIPVSDAGIDQTICNTTATLAANTPSANETGAWTILSGTAIITDPTNPATAVTSISTSTVELTWTLTNSLGGCSNQNNIIISSNLPITASATSQTVDIGKTINIDVQSSATVNTGDVLTTTLTTTPTQGNAVVQADGSIDFTPYDDAATTDTFTFRITNQCLNFDEQIASITIVNQPPVIDSTSFVATTNTLELTFDLNTLISDPNNNLDFNSLRIVSQPISGAIATIDANGVLTIDYRGVSYTGDDELEIEICDLVGVCTVQLITIPNVEVGGDNPPIKVFNAVSPNGDGFHDYLEIENIEFYPNNTVIILNRWGDEVSKFQGYNNQDIVFESTTLPAGTYYYHVLSGVDGVNTETGFFLLKLDNN